MNPQPVRMPVRYLTYHLYIQMQALFFRLAKMLRKPFNIRVSGKIDPLKQ